MNEKVCILIKISQQVFLKGLIDNKQALVKIMAWGLTGNKPISEPVMAFLTDAYMHHSASMS